MALGSDVRVRREAATVSLDWKRSCQTLTQEVSRCRRPGRLLQLAAASPQGATTLVPARFETLASPKLSS